MSISEPFIRRPVATSLLMAGVVLLGILGYKLLPISALPTVDFPTIEVTTFYPGASADVMVSSITTPLERQFGQISGLASTNSTSSYGTSTTTLQFVLDRPIDDAPDPGLGPGAENAAQVLGGHAAARWATRQCGARHDSGAAVGVGRQQGRRFLRAELGLHIGHRQFDVHVFAQVPGHDLAEGERVEWGPVVGRIAEDGEFER